MFTATPLKPQILPVEIRGFCSLSVKKYNAHTGRNPKTGELTRVKSKKLPVFKVGKELIDRINATY